MTIRYIIRPQGINTTPRLLKDALNATRTLRYPYSSHRRPDWSRDFFLMYPQPETVTNANEQYTKTYLFARGTKRDQRLHLQNIGFPVPTLYSPTDTIPEGTYIARPFRHSGGRGYRIIRGTPIPSSSTVRNGPTEALATSTEESQNNCWNPATEYLQEFYPKNHEYRIVVCKGTPLLTLLKRVPEGLSNELPWNHSQGSSFVTVNEWSNNRLRHTNIYDLISQNQEFFQHIDLCGLDVMLSNHHPQPYVVTEINFCPSVTIPDNLSRIAQHVQGSILHR